MRLPRLIVRKMDIETNIQMIARYIDPEFLRNNPTRPFAERTYQLYPELRGMIQDTTSRMELYVLAERAVRRRYETCREEMEQKIVQYEAALCTIWEPLLKELFHIFELEEAPGFETITCHMGAVSSYPRDVISKEYFISYEKDIEFLLMASIHEIDHFLLFEKWKQMHGYENKREPLYPDVLWFLEEMAVDPTLNLPAIQKIAPYPQKAYEQFYEILVEGKPAEAHICELYQQVSSMENFLDHAYDWIRTYHQELC